jgi:nicotinate-nucleotide pyrophosphorylase (carboxylating)
VSYVKEPDIKDLVVAALKEDIGTGDITTETVIAQNKFIKAKILAKENLVVCGLNVASFVFRALDKDIKFKPLVREGNLVKKGRSIAIVSGRAKSILTAERVALNFLSLLSGISTKTRQYVIAVKPYKVKILDTRKTVPALRLLEKYAVRIGGGFNHRFSLDEMILVKDNHLKCIGGIKKLSGFSRKHRVEIEVKSLNELKKALMLCPEIIMLDNMSTKDIKRAVRIRNEVSAKTKLEASGGINLKNIKRTASCEVDMISIGDLTHSVKSADISLEVL